MRVEPWPGAVSVHFRTLGTPAPQGSKRVMRGRLIDANAATLRPYRAALAADAMDALEARCGDEATPTRMAVVVTAVFVLARPAGHWGSGRNAARLRPSAPAWPGVKPDVDKMARAVLDALTGVLWVDDAQVVDLHATKVYGAAPHTVVTVQAPPPQPAEPGASGA